MIHRTAQQKPFFVYGTLLPNQPNFGLWEDNISEIKTAFLDDSQIFDMGYYPMLIAGVEGSVKGKLIEIKQAAYNKVLTRIDNLEEYDPHQVEQSTYRRVRMQVRLKSGKLVDAWVYVGDIQLVQGSRKIISGDWLEYNRHRQTDIQSWWQAMNTLFGRPK